MKDYKGALDELERLREYATATNEAIDSLHELRERFGWSGGGWKAKAEQAVSANDALRGNYERALDKIGELEEWKACHVCGVLVHAENDEDCTDDETKPLCRCCYQEHEKYAEDNRALREKLNEAARRLLDHNAGCVECGKFVEALRELDASEPEHCCGLQGFGEPRDTCPACALDGDGVGEEK